MGPSYSFEVFILSLSSLSYVVLITALTVVLDETDKSRCCNVQLEILIPWHYIRFLLNSNPLTIPRELVRGNFHDILI